MSRVMYAVDHESRLKNWENRWSTGAFKRWQLSDRNPDLWNFMDRLCPNGTDVTGTFFIPLCGKSLDLKFLYDEGFKVFGVEFYEKAVQEFFAENNIPFEVSEPSYDYKIYSTPDKRLRIACGDFLDFRKEYLGDAEIKYVFDRGAFGVIEKEVRRQYVNTIKSLFEGSEVKYLLRVWQYDDWYKASPPLNCPKEMIYSLFEEDFEIEEVQRIECSTAAEGFGSPEAFQIVYLMTSRDE